MKLSPTTQAIILMLFAMASFATMSVTISILGNSLHSTQIVFMRNTVSLVLVLCWAAWLQKGVPQFPTTKLRTHFWRATFGICAMQMWFYSLTILPVTLATALSYTTPVFTTIIAILFMGERAGWRRILAICISFIGVWIILRPDTTALDEKTIIVLAASMLMAISGTLVKSLTRTEPPETIVFYMSVFMLCWSSLPVITSWQPFTAHQFWLVCVIALCSTIAHLCMTRAFMRTDMVVLMPFDFTRLLFTAILAYLLLGETADANTWWGAALIVISTIYIAHREASHKRKIAEKTAQ